MAASARPFVPINRNVMASADDRLQALVSGVADRVRDQLQQELSALADGVRQLTADARDEAAQHVRAEAENATAAVVSGAIAAERSAADERLARALDDARTAAQAAERQAELAGADALVSSIRALDAADSLTDMLTELAEASHRAAGRAAVLVVKGASLRGWAHRGFGPATTEAKLIDLPLDEAGVLAMAVQRGEAQAVSSDDTLPSSRVPAPFTPDVPERAGLAVPVVVDGHAVAVVYADDVTDEAQAVPSCWPEHVEILARHASRCAEALTARRTSARRVGAGGPGSHTDAEGARRYARLLISEIKLYHEALVEEGRKAGDLRQRLSAEIARARQMYEDRVPAALDGRAAYFEQELVRTLAGGDPILLGQAS
jgi:hypothetical protein